MNVNVTITPTQRALIDAHKARRALWERKATKPVLAIGQDNKPAVERIEAKVTPRYVPQWLAFQTQFNAHVIAYLRYKVDSELDACGRVYAEYVEPKKTMKEIVLEVLHEFKGISLDIVKGVRRDRKAVEARHMCMYEIKKQQPERSTPEIARFFNRDHSVVLHAVNKLKAKLDGDEQSIERVLKKRIRTASYLTTGKTLVEMAKFDENTCK